MLGRAVIIPLFGKQCNRNNSVRNVKRMRWFSAVVVAENCDEEQVWAMVKTKL